jgi:hypothetical protein
VLVLRRSKAVDTRALSESGVEENRVSGPVQEVRQQAQDEEATGRVESRYRPAFGGWGGTVTNETVVSDVPGESHVGDERAKVRKSQRSRARAKTKQAKPKKQRAWKDDKPRRVRECMRLMASGKWVPGITVIELSKKWTVSERAIEGDAAEASRRIRDGILLDEDLRANVIATLQDISASSETIANRLRLKQPRTAIEALRTKLEAVKAMAGVAGVEAPKKVQVGGNLGDLIGLAFSDPTNQG